jgi:hypothetical protein
LELTRQQVAELSEFYWDTDVSTKELQDYFGLPRAVHRYINPLAAGEECPNCSAVLYTRPGAPETEVKRSVEHAGTRAGAAGGAMDAPVTTAAAPEQKRSIGAAKKHFG